MDRINKLTLIDKNISGPCQLNKSGGAIARDEILNFEEELLVIVPQNKVKETHWRVQGLKMLKNQISYEL